MTTIAISPSSSSNKRKTLHDYFATHSASPLKKIKLSPTTHDSLPKPPTTSNLTQKPSTTSNLPNLPPGLSLHPNFITPAEESTLLNFLDCESWRTDLSRRTLHYGGTYCLMPPRTATPSERKAIESQIYTASPIPPELDFLITRMISAGFYTERNKPAFCIVNEYLPGHGISAHVENFRFGEPVCAVTLAGSDVMRFHELEKADDGSVRTGKAGKAPRTGVKRDVWLERRGMMVMTGESRRRWQHEITRGRVKGKEGGWRRVSLTFRTDVKD